MDNDSDVIVVGAGPAGLEAAVKAHDRGARVTIVEREKRSGGILKQCIHDGFGVMRYGSRLTGPEYACRARDEVSSRGIKLITQAFVHSIERQDERWVLTMVTPDEGIFRLRTTALVMATGCRERSDRQIFLHGDRPAGIFTAGQAQHLINTEGILPGRKVVILGSGDIGLIMARRLTLEGAQVLGVYEVKSEPSGLPRNIAQCLQDWDIPLHLSTTVTEIQGKHRVEAVTLCPVLPSGKPDRNQATRIECDTLILSVGLIPENDILQDLGIEIDPLTRGPVVDQNRSTNLPGVFVCGNALHVYDLVDYVSECGAIAGSAAAAYTAVCKSAVDVRVTGEFLYAVPRKIDVSAEEPPVLFFRVRRHMDKAQFNVRMGDMQILSRRVSFVSPPEMLRISISGDEWQAVRDAHTRESMIMELTEISETKND